MPKSKRQKTGFWAKFRPDYFVDSIYDIDPRWLGERHICAVIIDVDNTMMARFSRSPDVKLRGWVAALKSSGIRLLAVSNNWTERVKNIAGELELTLLAPAAKPFGPAFRIAIERLGAETAEIAIIGDQLFTDILGGNRAGIWTILVAPVSEVDLIHTRILRVFERALLKSLCGRLLIDGRWREGGR